MMLIIFTAAIGVWPASFVVAAETSSLRLRARTQGVGWTTNGLSGVIFGIAMPYAYNPDAGNLGGMTAYIFFALTLFALVLSYFILPEMKDRSIAEIDKMFELQLPARQFKSWHGIIESEETDSQQRTRNRAGSEVTLTEGLEVPTGYKATNMAPEETYHDTLQVPSGYRRTSMTSEDTVYVGGYGRIMDQEEV